MICCLNEKNIYLLLIYEFTQPSTMSRSPIFKQCKAGLNSKLPFSKTGCLNKVTELSLLNYLLIAGGRGENTCIHFLRVSM